MTYLKSGLKTILFSTSLSFAAVAADTGSSTKSAEWQHKDVSKQETLKRGAFASDRSADRKRIQIDPEIETLEKSSQQESKKIRPAERKQKSASHDFSFADAYVDLLYDEDYDGYYSEFRVTFDADTIFDYADVYAELYLSLNGGDWELYHVTEVFEIRGFSSYDDYSVATYLTGGYPPGNYDILIDLIDTYDNSYVATISADDLYSLSDQPLEDATYEDSVVYDSDVVIFDAEIQLLDDFDNDGYYRSYSLSFDADVNLGSTAIYAEIWSRDGTGEWYLETTTDDFIINGSSTLDTYILETTLQSGYATGYYDFKIDIFDSSTATFLTSSDAFDSQLSFVPLEDVSADTVPTTTTNVITSTVSVESGGAGSMFGILGLLGLALFLRRERKN